MSNKLQALVGWALASVLGGTIVLAFGAGRAAPERPAALMPESDSELAAQLDELSRQIGALRRFLDTRPPLALARVESVRTPVGPEVTTEWVEELRRLNETLRGTQGRVVGGAPPLSELAARLPARGVQSLFAPHANYLDDDFDRRSASQALAKQHLLWSVRDLVREYGIPDEVTQHKDIGFMLSYKDPSSELRAEFRLRDGLLYTATFQ